MRKPYWYFAFGLMALVLFVEYDLTKRSTKPDGQPRFVKLKSNPAPQGTGPAITQGNPAVMKLTDPLSEKLSQVSAEVGQLQSNPDEAEQKIQSLASTLTARDLNSLSNVISDKNAVGDQRAMAVELLSRHHSVEALKKLEQFVQDHDDSGTWSREREFESVLRAQAVEGIAAFPQKDLAITSLTQLNPLISESFLKDRISRSVANLKNQAPSAEKQDEDALEKLVE